jgi:DNA methylase/ParB-like nuclease domain
MPDAGVVQGKNKLEERSMGTTNLKQVPERVETWEIGRLVPSARNARTHSDAQVAEIAGSIRAFGFNVPVLVDKDGSIIAGHGRVLAARQLNLDRIPVLVLDHMSDAEKRGYAIADNKIALNAGWDDELLKIELETLRTDGIELEKLGFSEEELNALIEALKPVSVPNQDWVPGTPAKPVSQPGDLWQLGNHRLLCGDPLEDSSYAALLAGKLGAMLFTYLPVCLETACEKMIANSEGALYVGTPFSELNALRTAFAKAGGEWSAYIVWGKNTLSFRKADYQSQCEPILYGWTKGKPHYWSGAQDQGDLWMIDPPEPDNLQSGMKPVELVERAVINSSRRGDTVLDPFGGYGSTVIACEKTERAARVIELDPQYCDVIISRWEGFSGGEAIHSATGKPFVQLAAARPSAAPVLQKG